MVAVKKWRASLIALALVVGAAAQMVIVAAPAEAAATHRILITGDSITHGSSGDYTWRYRLWNKLSNTAPGDVSFVGTRTDLYDTVNNVNGSQYYAASFGAKAHAAQWGSSYVNELNNISSQVSSSGANVLVVMLGSNDLAFLTSPADTIANLQTYIQRARAASPGIDIVVGEVVNRYDPWGQVYTYTAEVNDYAARLQTLASDLNTSSQRVVIAPTRSGWNAQAHTWDGTHPNPTGEALIAQRVSQGLAQIGIGSASPDISGPVSWDVTGPAVSLTGGLEKASLAWSRTSTGSSGMLIETRLTNINEAWQRLPYAVGGEGWVHEGLVAGGNYQYRIVPSKGFSTGLPGPNSAVHVSGPTPGDISTMTASGGGASQYGGKKLLGEWSASANASGYELSSRVMHDGTLSWDELPYPVTTRSWTWEPLAPGRRMQLRVRPIRGFLNGTPKASSTIRTRGLPGNRAYAALGDSYSSGLGTRHMTNYEGGSCYRSPEAWMNLMQPDYNDWRQNYACAGATSSGIYSQISSMNSGFQGRATNPKLITLTVGGNDVGFGQVAQDCIIGYGSCTQFEHGTNISIDNLGPTLTNLYGSIKSAQPYADILVGGYPNVVEPGSSSFWNLELCTAFGNNERAMAERLVIRLNNTIANSAVAANVWSVGGAVRDQFLGHGACSSGEWINGPNADITSGGPSTMNSFHPTLGGQLAYAFAFSDALVARAG